jgi:amphiphysin
MLEKLQGFSSGRYDTAGTIADIATHYESTRTDAIERIDALNVTKRILSTGARPIGVPEARIT